MHLMVHTEIVEQPALTLDENIGRSSACGGHN